jgi:hypothetical protein
LKSCVAGAEPQRAELCQGEYNNTTIHLQKPLCPYTSKYFPVLLVYRPQNIRGICTFCLFDVIAVAAPLCVAPRGGHHFLPKPSGRARAEVAGGCEASRWSSAHIFSRADANLEVGPEARKYVPQDRSLTRAYRPMQV